MFPYRPLPKSNFGSQSPTGTGCGFGIVRKKDLGCHHTEWRSLKKWMTYEHADPLIDVFYPNRSLLPVSANRSSCFVMARTSSSILLQRLEAMFIKICILCIVLRDWERIYTKNGASIQEGLSWKPTSFLIKMRLLYYNLLT